MNGRMYLVEMHGTIYRLTAPAMRRYLRDGAAGLKLDLTEYSKLVGAIDYHPSNWERRDFAREFGEFKGRTKEPKP